MANNNLIYNAALAGALGGSTNERWITSISGATYIAQRNAAVAFATIVDASIPADPNMNDGKAQLILTLVTAIINSKAITNDAATSAAAAAVAAVYNVFASVLEPELAPSATPLSNARYVDRLTTVPIAFQNGSIALPYATIAQAIASLPTGGTIYATAGDYTSEGTINFGAFEWTLSTFNIHANYVYGAPGIGRIVIAALSSTFVVNLISVHCTGSASAAIALAADSCWFDGPITTGSLDAFDTRFFSTVGTITMGGGASFTDCALNVIAITSALVVTVRMIDCEITGVFSLTSAATGTFRICDRTNFFLQSTTHTLTNVTTTVQGTPGSNPAQPNAIAATGALGVVNIATMQSGGVLLLQPTGNYTIDGFTAKTNGFWFDIFVDSTNLAITGSLNQDVGATTTSIRNPYNLPYQLPAGTMTRMRWQFNRWRTCGPPTPASQAVISVPVPAIAVAATLAYLDVSLVGTVLAGSPANAAIVAQPQADLAAAGAGAGYYIDCRMSAANTVRLKFVGILAGGNVNFTFTRL